MKDSHFPRDYREYQVVSLPGPSHYFGGLALGNKASRLHRHTRSHPKKAALEVLNWIHKLHEREIPLIFLPPLMPSPSALGLSCAYIWCANLATFSPRCDVTSAHAHLTLANLNSGSHRRMEAEKRLAQLKVLFAKSSIKLHPPLCASEEENGCLFNDEGAANHMRLACPSNPTQSLDIFVYGYSGNTEEEKGFFQPRQSLQAQKKIAANHQLVDENRLFFLQQNPEVIGKGVFHNDVIATAHNQLLLFHEKAFSDPKILEEIKAAYMQKSATPLQAICILEKDLTVQEAVKSYLFNSQILSQKDRPGYLLVTPQQCESCPKTRAIIERLLRDPDIPLSDWLVSPLSESMKGGGGPACLRLRLLLQDEEALSLDRRFQVCWSLIDTIRAVVDESWPEVVESQRLQESKYVESLYQSSKQKLETLYEALGLKELLDI